MNAREAGRPPQPFHASRTRVERLVERLLLVAIGVSVALMLAGAVLELAVGDGPSHVLTVSSVPGALARLEPAAYLSLGLIVLIATPFVRVAGSIVVFALECDRWYVLVTAAVLAIMCGSVVLGGMAWGAGAQRDAGRELVHVRSVVRGVLAGKQDFAGAEAISLR